MSSVGIVLEFISDFSSCFDSLSNSILISLNYLQVEQQLICLLVLYQEGFFCHL